MEDLAELLADGNYIDTACERVGLVRTTYYDWMAKGAVEEDGPFQRFAHKMRRSLAKAEADALATIKQAADKDWKAAAWLLERTRPERYARPETRKVADPPPAMPRGAPAPGQDEEPAAGAEASSPFDQLDAVTDISAAPSRRAGKA